MKYKFSYVTEDTLPKGFFLGNGCLYLRIDGFLDTFPEEPNESFLVVMGECLSPDWGEAPSAFKGYSMRAGSNSDIAEASRILLRYHPEIFATDRGTTEWIIRLPIGDKDEV